ncbi:hypothetical protein [Xylophilus sp.]|uniref:hypothetical protein n=1 Tax=Xylophilus sp. TaxID=2653893 RepID=UPI0013B78569|nr:hypothetical protein [Xylophilus sp.]KAF1045541.1 MAG: Mesaconyl-C(4)-CoA hydratase [Xylophilus sp.]
MSTPADFMLAQARPGQALPAVRQQASAVQLFLYNAAIWNPHRIHCDAAYVTGVEGHPALVVDGPLQGDWMLQLVYAALGPGDALLSFRYQNRASAYADEPLTVGGTVAGVDGDRVSLSLAVTNAAGQATTLGSAVVRRAGAGAAE